MGQHAKIKTFTRNLRKMETPRIPSALTRTARRMLQRAGHTLTAAECAPVFRVRTEIHNGVTYAVDRKYARNRTLRLRAKLKHARRGPLSRKGRITVDMTPSGDA